MVRVKGIEVTGLKSVRRVQTSQMRPAIAAKGDVGSVYFGRPKVPGECVAGGDSVNVRVYDRTGEAVFSSESR